MTPTDSRNTRLTWILVAGLLLTALLVALLPRARKDSSNQAAQPGLAGAPTTSASAASRLVFTRIEQSQAPTDVSANKTVADKLARFTAKRREIVRALADFAGVKVPASVEQFFDALEGGRWEEAQELFKTMKDLRYSAAGGEVAVFWRAIVEANGAADQARTWPAQQLLDYGNAVLSSLRPGMAYLGGTDAGCFIPSMLDETSGAEPHLMLTQNALADSTYLDYLALLYGDRFTSLTSKDSWRAFQDYLSDARTRLAHDQAFPNEPKQVQPGEAIDLSPDTGEVQVSGQTAEMLFNERLVRKLMELNPGLSFALEESFPLKSTYAGAAPLGPLMELGVGQQNAVTPDTAAASVAYWQNTADRLLSEPDASRSPATLEAYARMMVAQANLLASHTLAREAEQTLRLADRLAPGNPEVVFNYVQLLAKQNRRAEARQVVGEALRAAPGNAQFQTLDQMLR